MEAPNTVGDVFGAVGSVFQHLDEVLALDDLHQTQRLAEEVGDVSPVDLVAFVFDGLHLIAYTGDLASLAIVEGGKEVDDLLQALAGEEDVVGHGDDGVVEFMELAGIKDVAAVIEPVKEVVDTFGEFVDVAAVEGGDNGTAEQGVDVVQHRVAGGLAVLDFFLERLQLLLVLGVDHLAKGGRGGHEVVGLLAEEGVEALLFGDEVLEEGVEAHITAGNRGLTRG